MINPSAIAPLKWAPHQLSRLPSCLAPESTADVRYRIPSNYLLLSWLVACPACQLTSLHLLRVSRNNTHHLSCPGSLAFAFSSFVFSFFTLTTSVRGAFHSLALLFSPGQTSLAHQTGRQTYIHTLSLSAARRQLLQSPSPPGHLRYRNARTASLTFYFFFPRRRLYFCLPEPDLASHLVPRPCRVVSPPLLTLAPILIHHTPDDPSTSPFFFHLLISRQPVSFSARSWSLSNILASQLS